MKSPYSLYSRRTRASGAGSTPDRVPYSPSSSYSSASTVKKRNPLSVAAKSMAGVFVACFTPPEPEPNNSRDFGYSEELRAPSGKFLVCFVDFLTVLRRGFCWEKTINLRCGSWFIRQVFFKTFLSGVDYKMRLQYSNGALFLIYLLCKQIMA